MTSAPISQNPTHALWIGTFPAPGTAAGEGEGIWRVDVDATGEFTAPRMAVRTPAPTFVALHPSGRSLYAASEIEQGAVDVFAVEDERDQLTAVASVATDGSPCHVSTSDGAVWAANYGGGSVARVAVDDDGRPVGAPTVTAHGGSGPDPDRQEGPHAHFVAAVGPEVWAADLGADVLVRYAPDGARVGDVALPPGTGPRHFVHVPGAVLVVGELDPAVFVVALGDEDAAEPAVTRRVPLATPGADPRAYPSHIALSADGTRLFVALRGPDSVVALAVEETGGGIELRVLAESPIGGAWPRHFAVVAGPDGRVDGDLLVVAQQNSDALTALRVDRTSGRADSVGALTLPAPACVLVDGSEG